MYATHRDGDGRTPGLVDRVKAEYGAAIPHVFCAASDDSRGRSSVGPNTSNQHADHHRHTAVDRIGRKLTN